MSERANEHGMHPDEAQIHDFVDGELTTEGHASVASHLTECPECRGVAGSARALREEATRVFGGSGATPPHDVPDQWSAIEARISEKRRARRLMPLAAAAVLVLASSATIYAVLKDEAGSGGAATADAAVETPAVEPAVAIAVAYLPGLSDLERILAEERGRLQPETIAVLEANLEILNAAIREIEEALAADPMHRGNLRALGGIYQAKLDALRQVVGTSRGA